MVFPTAWPVVKIPTIATLPSLTARKGRDGMEKLNMNQPPIELADKKVSRLNDYTEIKIGGVIYRVKSVFSDKGQLGDLLDLAAMEKIGRIA